jgi:hypothetical protein
MKTYYDKVLADAMIDSDAVLGRKLARRLEREAFAMGALAASLSIPASALPPEMVAGFNAYDAMMVKLTQRVGDPVLMAWVDEGSPMAGSRRTGDFRNVVDAEMREDWIGT